MIVQTLNSYSMLAIHFDKSKQNKITDEFNQKHRKLKIFL